MTQKRDYDSTVARIAGNLLSGFVSDNLHWWNKIPSEAVAQAVITARAIVAETKRTEPPQERAK